MEHLVDFSFLFGWRWEARVTLLWICLGNGKGLCLTKAPVKHGIWIALVTRKLKKDLARILVQWIKMMWSECGSERRQNGISVWFTVHNLWRRNVLHCCLTPSMLRFPHSFHYSEDVASVKGRNWACAERCDICSRCLIVMGPFPDLFVRFISSQAIWKCCSKIAYLTIGQGHMWLFEFAGKQIKKCIFSFFFF